MKKNVRTLEDSLIDGAGSILNGFANRYQLNDQKEQLLKQRDHELSLAQTRANAELYNKQLERNQDLKLAKLKINATKPIKKELTQQEKDQAEFGRIWTEAQEQNADPLNLDKMKLLDSSIKIGIGSPNPRISQLYKDVEKKGSHNLSPAQIQTMSKKALGIAYQNLLDMEKLGITMDQDYMNKIKQSRDYVEPKAELNWVQKNILRQK